MALLKGSNCLLVLLLDLRECLVPALVEVLVLHQVSLLHLFPLAGLVVHQLLSPAVVILNLQLLNTVLCHLCFNVFAFHFALFAMLLQDSTIK